MEIILQFVEITTDTRTAHGNFYAGEIRKVSAEIAGLLKGNDWARDIDIEVSPANNAAPSAVTLEVDNAGLGVQTEEI